MVPWELWIFRGEKKSGRKAGLRLLKTGRWTEKIRDKHLETTSPTGFRNFGSSTESTVCFWDNLKLGFHKICVYIYIYIWGLFRSDVPYVPKRSHVNIRRFAGEDSGKLHALVTICHENCRHDVPSDLTNKKRHKKAPTPKCSGLFWVCRNLPGPSSTKIKVRGNSPVVWSLWTPRSCERVPHRNLANGYPRNDAVDKKKLLYSVDCCKLIQRWNITTFPG